MQKVLIMVQPNFSSFYLILLSWEKIYICFITYISFFHNNDIKIANDACDTEKSLLCFECCVVLINLVIKMQYILMFKVYCYS